MKISIPRPRQGKPKGGHHRRGKSNPGWLHGRWGTEQTPQKLQSPVREWHEMTPQERAEILERAK